MSDNLQHTPLNSMAEYIVAMDTLCRMAQHHLFIFDRNFADSGFNSTARHDMLRSFLLVNPTNRLLLLTHDAHTATQDCPRLMQLLRQFSSGMHIYQTPKCLHHLTEPFAVADEASFVRRFPSGVMNGILTQGDPTRSRAYKARFEEMWAASRSGVTATTLGL